MIDERGSAGYPYGYLYDYSGVVENAELDYTTYDIGYDGEYDFKLVVNGYCAEFSIYINNVEYTVTLDEPLSSSQSITINSMDKTVIKTLSTGETVNMFNYRGDDVFTKISGPTVMVSTGGSTLDFTLTIFINRSEPEWS